MSDNGVLNKKERDILTEKEDFIARIRGSPDKGAKQALLDYIAEGKEREIIGCKHLLGPIEKELRGLAEEDSDNICRLAILAWGTVEEDKYFSEEINLPQTKEELLGFLQAHERFDGLQEQIAVLTEKAQALDSDNRGKVWEIASAMHYLLQVYFYCLPGEEPALKPAGGVVAQAQNESADAEEDDWAGNPS